MPVGLDCDTMSLGMLAPGFEQHEGQIISSVSNVTHWCVSCASGPLPMKGSSARTPTNVMSLRTLASAFFVVPSSPLHCPQPGRAIRFDADPARLVESAVANYCADLREKIYFCPYK